MRGVISPTSGYRALSTVPPRSMGVVPPFRLNHANGLANGLEFYQAEIAGQFPTRVTRFPEAFIQKQDEIRWTSGFTLAMRYSQSASSTQGYGTLFFLSYGSTAADNGQVGFAQGNPTLNQLVLNARLNTYNTTYEFLSGASVTFGQTYDVAVTRDSGGTVRAYLNGTQVFSTFLTPPDPSRVSLSIGRYTDATRAEIRHAAAWTRPLSQNEIISYFSNPNQLHLNW